MSQDKEENHLIEERRKKLAETSLMSFPKKNWKRRRQKE